MRAVALALLIVCTACTHAQYTASVNSGAVVTTSSAQVRIDGATPLSVAIFAAALAAAASEDLGAYPSFTESLWRRPPPMNPDRAISEQDCTKPIVFTENLRCR
jgi:hypothetical protein